MSGIKKGDIVGRKSYGKDIMFVVKRIIKSKKTDKNIAILKGLVERIEADSDLNDLEIIEQEEINKSLNTLNQKLSSRTNKKGNNKKYENYQIGIFTKNKRNKEKIITGKILHLDRR